MALERTEELYKLLLSKGYPKEFCAEIAYKNMSNTVEQIFRLYKVIGGEK